MTIARYPALLLLLLCALPAFDGCAHTITVPITPIDPSYVTPYVWNDSLRPSSIMIVGDLQPTSWLERVFLGRSQNDSVRSAMIDATLARTPDLMLLLGDQVGEGEYASEWRRFDTLMAPICRAHQPVYAVVGNHDYGLATTRGIRHCVARFPYATSLPQVVRLADSVVMLVVDSNIETLPDHLQERQEKLYRQLLTRFDRDPAVRGVIVASHHPPYSNSDLPIDRRVREMFAPPFLKATKTMLFLSGHIHSYERIEIEGKTFIVSGGGGGPRREVDTSASRPFHTDRYRLGTLRYHHFVDLTVRPEGLRGEVYMLVDEEFKLGDGFALRWGLGTGD